VTKTRGIAEKSDRGWARRRLSPYAVELAITVGGLGAAVIEEIVTDRSDIALLVALISVFFALAVAAIRQDLAAQIRSASEEHAILDAIPDPQWRAEAAAELARARATFASWANGARRIGEPGRLRHQVHAVSTATRTVSAVHLALDGRALKRWLDEQDGFDKLVDAYRQLPRSVHCRRVLVLDETSALCAEQDGQRIIADDTLLKVCKLQTGSRPSEGLGFDLRVRWVSPADRRIGDMLIVDDREVCSIESIGRGQFGELDVLVNPALVAARVRAFEDLWTESVPIERCLPPSGEASGPSVD
jgi:hypothetical protein